VNRYGKGVLLACALLLFAGYAVADEIASVQLVGNFYGITCEPDASNDMDRIAAHDWRKLKFIDEPGEPDTIYFKFTKNYSYFPSHWGWSGVWGIAEYDWDPPNIATVLPDSGFYYFYFNDSSYVYSIERPSGSIGGVVNSDDPAGAPEGTRIVLLDALNNPIWTCQDFCDSTFLIENLPASVYSLTASAAGYNDTTINDILLDDGEMEWVSIYLTPSTAVYISSASCEHAGDGILLTWSTSCCRERAGFDVYRGREPVLQAMEKRTALPVYGYGNYRYLDACDDQSIDYYYYLVEVDDEQPTRYGPIFIRGAVPGIGSGLGQNYPNPFNPATIIPYTIGSSGADKEALISFYDVAGRLVDRHELGTKTIGEHTFRWNPALSRQGSIPSGVYYCRLQIGKEIFTSKLILLR
jgi:hypothetical protein